MRPEDLFANFVLLLFAGHETTRNLIGNAVHLLLIHSDELQKVKEDPSLWKNAVDETLRFDTPIQIISRIAGDDIEVHGKHILNGQQLFMVLASGNRDPAHFPDPGRFDIKREVGRHLAFGMGPHFCLGSLLPEAEVKIALETLFERFPDLT